MYINKVIINQFIDKLIRKPYIITTTLTTTSITIADQIGTSTCTTTLTTTPITIADQIGTSKGAAHWSVGLRHSHDHTTQTQHIGLGHRHKPQQKLLRVGLDHRHEFSSRPMPLAKLNDLQHKKQPGASSHATMTSMASLLGYRQPSHHGITGIPRSRTTARRTTTEQPTH